MPPPLHVRLVRLVLEGLRVPPALLEHQETQVSQALPDYLVFQVPLALTELEVRLDQLDQQDLLDQ